MWLNSYRNEPSSILSHNLIVGMVFILIVIYLFFTSRKRTSKKAQKVFWTIPKKPNAVTTYIGDDQNRLWVVQRTAGPGAGVTVNLYDIETRQMLGAYEETRLWTLEAQNWEAQHKRVNGEEKSGFRTRITHSEVVPLVGDSGCLLLVRGVITRHSEEGAGEKSIENRTMYFLLKLQGSSLISSYVGELSCAAHVGGQINDYIIIISSDGKVLLVLQGSTGTIVRRWDYLQGATTNRLEGTVAVDGRECMVLIENGPVVRIVGIEDNEVVRTIDLAAILPKTKTKPDMLSVRTSGDKCLIVGYNSGKAIKPAFLPLRPSFIVSDLEQPVTDSIACLDMDGEIEWNKENPYGREISYSISPDGKWITIYRSNAHEMIYRHTKIAQQREANVVIPCTLWVDLIDADDNTRFSEQFEIYLDCKYIVGWNGTDCFYCGRQNVDESWDVTTVDVRTTTGTTLKIQSSTEKISLSTDYVLAGDEQGISIYKISDLIYRSRLSADRS